MQQQHIGRGADVEFESQEGPQRGTVEQILLDVSHQRRLAIVRVPHTMNNMPWLMKVDDLRPAAPLAH